MGEKNNDTNSIISLVLLFCAGILLLAMANMPSGYYKILRLVVFIGGGIGVINASMKKQYLWAFLLAIPAIIFNPIIPIYLYDQEKWIPYDIGGAIIYIIRGFQLLTKK